MEDFAIKLVSEAPLAFALWQAAKILAPILAEHLKQNRAILDRLTVAVEAITGRLDKVEAKLDAVAETVENLELDHATA